MQSFPTSCALSGVDGINKYEAILMSRCEDGAKTDTTKPSPVLPMVAMKILVTKSKKIVPKWMESALGRTRVPATTELLADERRVPTIGTGRSGVAGEAFARFDFKRHVAGASLRVTAPLEAEGGVVTPHPVQNMDPALATAPQLSQNSKIGSLQYCFNEIQ